MTEQRIFLTLFLLVLVGVVIFGVFSKVSQKGQIPNQDQLNQQAISGQDDLSSTTSGQLSGQPQKKQYPRYPGDKPKAQLTDKRAIITTNKGVIEFNIDPEATKAASNFIFLSEDKFYDGLSFHRVEPGFVIQGGDPAGNGTGGPGYTFADDPVKKPYKKGTVAMANRGPNTNGSQFFIVLSDNVGLAPSYSIFGQVTKGMDVVEKIRVGDTIQSVTITSSN